MYNEQLLDIRDWTFDVITKTETDDVFNKLNLQGSFPRKTVRVNNWEILRVDVRDIPNDLREMTIFALNKDSLDKIEKLEVIKLISPSIPYVKQLADIKKMTVESICVLVTARIPREEGDVIYAHKIKLRKEGRVYPLHATMSAPWQQSEFICKLDTPKKVGVLSAKGFKRSSTTAELAKQLFPKQSLSSILL